MNKPIDLGAYRKRKAGRRLSGTATAFVMGSIEHVAMGASRRGFVIVPDASVPLFFSVLSDKKALVGSCEFSQENRLIGYSLVNPADGKYTTNSVGGRMVKNSVSLTRLFFEGLASL